jgi:hypothetical protein
VADRKGLCFVAVLVGGQRLVCLRLQHEVEALEAQLEALQVGG